MTKDEALKLALEALESSRVFVTTREKIKHPEGVKWYDQIITAIKKALAQPEQEPVAYMSHNKKNFVSADDVGNSVPNWTDYYPTPLYTTPSTCPTCEALARTVMMDQTGRDA